jgi:putative YhdH/YhfP family quinone oxidoreductase
MEDKEFKALVVTEGDGKFVRQITKKKISELPEGQILIKVKYSSLNYKDALSATGNKGITRKYPHTPGIDAAGVIEASDSEYFKKGDKVLVTGYDLGMNTSGGFAEYVRVPEDWVVKLPAGLSFKESMIFGTAGFTAGLSLFQLELNEVSPQNGEILVTGATGGVGSLAVAILSKAGYKVAAATGKQEKHKYLESLGASRVLSREEVDIQSDKPMLDKKWAGVVDTVGGNILTSAIKSTHHYGSVTSCGLTQSNKIDMTVYPFILRGVNLLGIASAETPMYRRKQIWDKLSSDWKPESLSDIAEECTLDELNEKIEQILHGSISGRIVVTL